MKVVVIGGSGLIGSQVVRNLREQGHEATAASPSSGVNTLTGEGVREALTGADVVVDVTNSPSFADQEVLNFFTTSTGVLLQAEVEAGVKHHVALSIVGTDALPDSGYMRAKVAQENLITAGPVAYSIVRATQFFEFAAGIAGMATAPDGTVPLPSASIQPIAASEVARIVTEVAIAPPRNAHFDIAGPQKFGLDEFIRLAVPDAKVVTDQSARDAGAKLETDSLVPQGEATLSEITLASWQQAQR